jgi:hypothetical protein
MSFDARSLLKSVELWSAYAAVWIAAGVAAFAHGFAGDRFFPATISTAANPTAPGKKASRSSEE